MDFIGREAELELLESKYSMDHSLIILKGRRRVGKSRLLEEFLKDKEHLYFEVNSETSSSILMSLSKEVSDDIPVQFQSWTDALRYYVSRAKGKKVIAIDEFQYAVKADKNLLIEMQVLWDRYLSKSGVMLILCGSSLVSMNGLTADSKSPLYGRNACDLYLRPLTFRQTLKGDYRTSVERYAVTGGIPHYMELVGDTEPMDAVVSTTMTMGSPLLNEGEYLLCSEFSNLSSYNTYMKAIANGNRTMEKITGAVQAPSQDVLPYIKRLMDVGMVEKIVPITEPIPEKSRNSQYVISDCFLSLWFRFVYPYRSSIIRMENDTAVQDLKDHFIDAHVSFVFEDVCREELKRYLRDRGISADYGKHWGDGEIDLIALDRKSSVAYVCECKFKVKPMSKSMLNSLISKASKVKGLKDFDIRYCLFSVSGFNDDLRPNENVILFNCGEPL